MECIFCKIIDKSLNAEIVYEDELILAFMDIDKKAPVHFLVVPKKHIVNCDYINDDNINYISHIFLKIKDICVELNVQNGYRVVTNCGYNAGQTVDHLHFHVLGNKKLPCFP